MACARVNPIDCGARASEGAAAAPGLQPHVYRQGVGVPLERLGPCGSMHQRGGTVSVRPVDVDVQRHAPLEQAAHQVLGSASTSASANPPGASDAMEIDAAATTTTGSENNEASPAPVARSYRCVVTGEENPWAFVFVTMPSLLTLYPF